MRIFLSLLVMALPLISTGSAAESHIYDKGTLVSMENASCTSQNHRIIAALSGTQVQSETYDCWQYILVADKVVYRLSARKSRVLLPLAEYLQFRLGKGEMLVRLDDSIQELRLDIVSMSLRSEWKKAERRSDTTVTCVVDAASQEHCRPGETSSDVHDLHSGTRLVARPH